MRLLLILCYIPLIHTKIDACESIEEENDEKSKSAINAVNYVAYTNLNIPFIKGWNADITNVGSQSVITQTVFDQSFGFRPTEIFTTSGSYSVSNVKFFENGGNKAYQVVNTIPAATNVEVVFNTNYPWNNTYVVMPDGVQNYQAYFTQCRPSEKLQNKLRLLPDLIQAGSV